MGEAGDVGAATAATATAGDECGESREGEGEGEGEEGAGVRVRCTNTHMGMFGVSLGNLRGVRRGFFFFVKLSQ